jgi:protein-S-isoprenylcysteine O-methyltransferase Ste14
LGRKANETVRIKIPGLSLDRIIALVAVLPFFIPLYFAGSGMDFPMLAYGLETVVMFATMVTRRPPQRTAKQASYWLMAFVATYWLFLVSPWIDPGQLLVPKMVVNGLSLMGLVILIWARLSLGRNIGYVPAQRQIVTTGPYRYLRHPIYLGSFVTLIAIFLSIASVRNFVIIGLAILWYLIKSLMEERFLSADPRYAEYLRRVRWRWIPYVV